MKVQAPLHLPHKQKLNASLHRPSARGARRPWLAGSSPEARELKGKTALGLILSGIAVFVLGFWGLGWILGSMGMISAMLLLASPGRGHFELAWAALLIGAAAASGLLAMAWYIG
ncbi:hypothetical protein [Phaeodactylibacter luteus]|uniref:Uncharacterized protein n=1 Tax=Phaeodactylibacter luteus TaxID=1564516 RepID=A0A5C6RJW4_9BACT|nr:hypothetical protein [Phaeodactylibacter luteus]TXB62463.1 hypothetical protein FRY97_13805 [Phaeodactylibacter luteus]